MPSLYRFGVRLVETAHRVNDAREQSDWGSQLIGAMKGELNSGIGAQTQSWSASVVSTGFGAMYDLWATEQDDKRQKTLMSKGELTKEEREELATLKGAEFNRLEIRHEADPKALSAEERAMLDTYKAQDQAARQAEFKASVEDMSVLTDKVVKKTEMTPEEVARYEGYMNDPEMHGIRQQMEVDLRKADAEHAAAEGRAKDAAAEAARRDQRDAGPDKSKHRDPEPGTLPAVASAKAPEGVDSSAAIGNILRKEKVKEGLAGMFTPEQLAQNVADAEYKKTPSYQVQQELQHIKHRALEMQGMSAEQKNTPEWRKESYKLFQDYEKIKMFDQEYIDMRVRVEGPMMLAGGAAIATMVAPEVMIPLMGRMALGHLAGKASYEAYTSVGVPSSDAAFLSSVVEGGTGGHMPAGGDLARGAALTTKAAASATAESGGLLNRLREAGQDLAQWRPDPHAMGSGFLPLTRKAPSAPKVAEAAVSGAPVKNVFDANSYAHLSKTELKSLYRPGVYVGDI